MNKVTSKFISHSKDTAHPLSLTKVKTRFPVKKSLCFKTEVATVASWVDLQVNLPNQVLGL